MDQRKAVEEGRPERKRMLAAGRKINGTWQVTTFLRAAAGGCRETFWESRPTPPSTPKRRRGSRAAH